MALLEALSSADLLNFLACDATTLSRPDEALVLENCPGCKQLSEPGGGKGAGAKPETQGRKRAQRRGTCVDKAATRGAGERNALRAQQGARKKRKRRPRVCKNKEEAENQRMTHIAVERNRRKQMNEHLAVLRSLMPDSYVQRGDQASIVGGAVEFVKELEHLLQNLEAQKLQLSRGGKNHKSQNQDCKDGHDHHEGDDIGDDDIEDGQKQQEDHQGAVSTIFPRPPFSQFFLYPQITWSQFPNSSSSNNNNNNSGRSPLTASIADIEVTLIETHANLRILWRRNPRHLSKLVVGFHSLRLAILHLSVTTLDPLVLYSISAKVEEGCKLSTVDDIAGAVHHMLRIIEEGRSDALLFT
ncbi:hypothetical protein MLD38_020820 [Melastoma candidum]|uniref:Uncharacterized protein n=1 Tax=Melastoma candidum TaxID=119954 RepID=A0ACB9QG09_9MYRT|nr:hypothetical protein MLD38_020820 [Melastoma candidum]